MAINIIFFWPLLLYSCDSLEEKNNFKVKNNSKRQWNAL